MCVTISKKTTAKILKIHEVPRGKIKAIQLVIRQIKETLEIQIISAAEITEGRVGELDLKITLADRFDLKIFQKFYNKSHQEILKISEKL